MPGLAEPSAKLQSKCWPGLGSHLGLTGKGSASKAHVVGSIQTEEAFRFLLTVIWKPSLFSCTLHMVVYSIVACFFKASKKVCLLARRIL